MKMVAEDDATEAEDGSEQLATVVLLIQVVLMGAVLLIGKALNRLKISWMSEAGAAMLLGLLVGLIVHLAGAKHDLRQMLVFKKFLFLDVLLPTIMFYAGYTLDPQPFLRNVGSICAFAFLGTTVATFVVGGFMTVVGQAGLATQLPLIYNLLFGAIISATDPVTVLAVFSSLGAQEDLYINVFGESVLNDAVAMVLYNTLKVFGDEPVTTGSVFKGIGMFLGIFLGSVSLGLIVALGAAYLFRTQWMMESDHGPLVATGMVVVFAFVSYLTAEVAQLSGICSVLFCGMVMRSYVTPNLPQQARQQVEHLFATMSGLFEMFLFVYIGLALFLDIEVWSVWSYTGWCLVALAVSRALNILPCAALVNWLRLPQARLSVRSQFMIWWSGLRGAMAFALSVDAAAEYGRTGAVMKTCTFFIILTTVLFNGGSSAYLLDKLRLRQEQHNQRRDDAENSGSDDINDPGSAVRQPLKEQMSQERVTDDDVVVSLQGVYSHEQGTPPKHTLSTELKHSSQGQLSHGYASVSQTGEEQEMHALLASGTSARQASSLQHPQEIQRQHDIISPATGSSVPLAGIDHGTQSRSGIPSFEGGPNTNITDLPHGANWSRNGPGNGHASAYTQGSSDFMDPMSTPQHTPEHSQTNRWKVNSKSAGDGRGLEPRNSRSQSFLHRLREFNSGRFEDHMNAIGRSLSRQLLTGHHQSSSDQQPAVDLVSHSSLNRGQTTSSHDVLQHSELSPHSNHQHSHHIPSQHDETDAGQQRHHQRQGLETISESMQAAAQASPETLK